MTGKTLHTKWTSHLRTKDEKESLEKAIRHDTTVLSRLLDILEEMQADIDNAELSINDFDSPSWSHKAAFRLGNKAGLKKAIDLLKFLKE